MKRILSVLAFLVAIPCYATVTTTSNSVTYTCSGSTGPYAFTFSAYDAPSIQVSTTVTATGVVTILSTPTQYSIVPVNNSYSNGGSVTLVTACPTGSTLTIQRMTEQTQSSAFTQNMPALYATFESGLDKLTMEVQDTNTSGNLLGILGSLPGCTSTSSFLSPGSKSCSPGGGGGGGGTPGGSNKQIQFNNSGSFAGSNATLDSTGNLVANANTQFNVLLYGAKGDCSTDDSAAITAADTAAYTYATGTQSPAAVYFPKPPGGCYLTSTIQWNGAPWEGQPNGIFGSGVPALGVIIKGKPGQDILHGQDPTTTNFTWAKSPSIRNISFLLDDSSAGTFSHRFPGRTCTDGAMATGSAVLTTANCRIACGDVGQAISVAGAGSGGTTLVTTIASTPTCWAQSQISYASQITLAAANASGSPVSGAKVYVSVNGYATTYTVGAAALAFDNSDGNPADWTQTGQMGLVYPKLENVNIYTTSGTLYGTNKTAAIFTQGAWGPYGLDAKFLNLHRTVWGVVQACSDVNTSYQSCSNDYQTWDHMDFEGIQNPWIEYNGLHNVVQNVQLVAGSGMVILPLVTTFADYPDSFTLKNVGWESANTAYGFRFAGDGAIIENATISTGSTVAIIDGTNVFCTECAWRSLNLNGSHNRIFPAGGEDESTATSVNGGRDNVITTAFQASPTNGMQPGFYQAPVPERSPYVLSGIGTPDTLNDGNAGCSSGYNFEDLDMWPTTINFNTFGNPLSNYIGTDTTSPTGAYMLMNNTANAYGSGVAVGTNSPSFVTPHICTGYVTLTAILKCVGGTTASLGIGDQTGGFIASGSASITCSTSSYQTFTGHYNVTGSSTLVYPRINLTGLTTGIQMARAYIRPDVATLNGYSVPSATVPGQSLNGQPPGVLGQIPTQNGAGANTYTAQSPSLQLANGGATITSSYALLCDSATASIGIQDRGKIAEVGSGGSVTIPDLAGTGCAGFYGSVLNANTSSITVSRQTSDTFNLYTGGGAPTTGLTSFTVPPGSWATFEPGVSATTYDVRILLTSGSSFLSASGDTSCAQDTTNLNAAITSALSTNIPIQLGAGTYYINALSTITGPLTIRGVGAGTVINYCGTTGNAFYLSFHNTAGVNNFAGTETLLSDFSLQQKSGVTPTAGVGIKLDNGGSGYQGNTHIERVDINGMWSGFYFGTGLYNNWLYGSVVSNCIGGIGIEYNTPSPGGDLWATDDSLAAQTTNQVCNLQIDQSDTWKPKGLKLNGGSTVVFTRVAAANRVFFQDPSFEGVPLSNVSITNFQITSNVVTFTNSGTNGLSVGMIVAISGLSTGTYLNGQSLTVLAAGLNATTFEAAFTHANVGSTADTGTGTPLSCMIQFGPNGSNPPSSIQFFGGGIGLATYDFCAGSAVSGAQDASFSYSSNLYGTNIGISTLGTYASSGNYAQFGSILPTGQPQWLIGEFTPDSTRLNTASGLEAKGTTVYNSQICTGAGNLCGYQMKATDAGSGTHNAGLYFSPSATSSANGWCFYATDASCNLGVFGDFHVESSGPITATGSLSSISGCSISAHSGGNWGGQFTSGTTGTCTVTITPGQTAPHGLSCWGSDTATHVYMAQSGTSATTCAVTGSTTSGDVVTWHLEAY